MKKIELTQNQYAIVDDEDFEYLNQFNWHAVLQYNTFYASRNAKRGKGIRKHFLMHRVVMKAEPKQMIDHINGIGTDNRKCNLRFCTPQQNSYNKVKSKSNASGFKGVSWNKLEKKWRAKIKIGENRIDLGKFTNPQDAARAYDEAAKKYHGEFARLNIIKGRPA